MKAGITDRIVVATPDAEIVEACRQFGAEAILTSPAHPTGTDRIAEVSHTVEADFYVNLQGDEPLIRPETIAACAKPILDDPSTEMASVYSPCPDGELHNPAVVKVVTDLNGYALYFSRFGLPFQRNATGIEAKKHVGIYAYGREVVRAFSEWPQSPLETTESLEQLRFLEHGVKIKMSLGQGSELAVDTPEQAVEVREILRKQGSSTTL